MELILETPTRLRLPREWVGTDVETTLRKRLKYEDLRVTFEWQRWKRVQKTDSYFVSVGKPRHWFVQQNGREALDAKVEQLNRERHQNLLRSDERGLWTYSGLATRLSEEFNLPVRRAFGMPESKLIPWANQPEFEPRWYQSEAVEKLLAKGHGAVSLATGTGKSLIIAHLIKELGLRSIVCAPTLGIAGQLLSDLVQLFGKKRVGQFFDGKKESDKHIVVAVGRSLTLLNDKSPHWEKIRNRDVVISDEAHTWAADTLTEVALNLFEDVPYRFFMSATQIRTDGLQVVLDGIIGDIVIEMDARKAIEQGFLSPLRMHQILVRSNSKFMTEDGIKMNRTHLHDNELVYEHAAKTAKWGMGKGRRILVLIEEVSQFEPFLRNLLKISEIPPRIAFAHGGVTAANKESVPDMYWKSDPLALVKALDRGELDMLVGTSCIGMGVDTRSPSMIISLVGGSADVRIRQNVGRGTRKFPGKEDCLYVDYGISNKEKLLKQADKRLEVLDSIYGPVKRTLV